MSQIQRFRKLAKLTQAELAEAMQVAVITVVKWEAGDRTPRTGKIRSLAKVLRCRPEQLL